MNELYNGQEIENIPDTVSIKDIKGIDFSYVHGPINVNIDRNRIAMCSRDSKIMIANVFKSLVNGIAKSKGAARIALIQVKLKVLLMSQIKLQMLQLLPRQSILSQN